MILSHVSSLLFIAAMLVMAACAEAPKGIRVSYADNYGNREDFSENDSARLSAIFARKPAIIPSPGSQPGPALGRLVVVGPVETVYLYFGSYAERQESDGSISRWEDPLFAAVFAALKRGSFKAEALRGVQLPASP
jgi:hypothetical protein